MDDREIVRTWSALQVRDLEPTAEMVAEWLRWPLTEVENRMIVLRRLEQLP